MLSYPQQLGFQADFLTSPKKINAYYLSVRVSADRAADLLDPETSRGFNIEKSLCRLLK